MSGAVRVRMWPWAAAAVTAGAVTVALVFALTPGSFELRGSLSLQDPAGIAMDSTECFGTGGYSDIRAGAQVTVYDSAGDTVAIGSLGRGYLVSGGVCDFGITVAGVPAGDLFQVEVSHRGKVAATEEDARAGLVKLTLG